MSLDCKTPADVMSVIKEHDVQFIDVRFTDVPGMQQHFTVPVGSFDEDAFEEGLGFDGSSVRGFQQINESDMLVIPDPTTAFLDPFTAHPTLVLIANVKDPVSGEWYTRDPRYIAQRAEAYLRESGIADTAYFGPEAEFFLFSDVRYSQGVNHGYYYIDSPEGSWNTGKEEGPNLGYKPRPKEGYFPVAPSDSYHDVRSEMVLLLEQIGIEVEAHHHEVATGGQAEIDFKFGTLVNTADRLMAYKYIVKNVARRHGLAATFMPKPLFGDNGSGMHVHQSLWKNGDTLFFDAEGYAGLSQTAKYYIGGLLKHAPALLALTSPTVNSYHRLVPGFEAPVNLVYSRRNRSAAVRIPMYSNSPKAKRIEFRCPDASCNPYLAFAALLLAGLDGIKNQIDPGKGVDFDLYDLCPEELAKIPSVPATLTGALDALEADHEFLLAGDVFTTDFIESYIDYKRTVEVDPIRLRPHPYEFFLYFDI
ncbi:MAG: type I glutamate--ammonia ligase [Phototrophicales bacterium]|nr:MAG: type I glutamate--ammonia ligase [Phototrophicales bacterium]